MCLCATVFTLDEPVAVNFLRGAPLFDALVRGESTHPAARTFVTKKLESFRQPTVKIS